MNFLAHLYLSGDNHRLLIGNFIADHIKGSAIETLPDDVHAGVLLHRQIDAFTDRHTVVAESKLRLRPVVGKYAPVVADIFYDHFLAAKWTQFSPKPLDIYARECYGIIQSGGDFIPERTRRMLRYMIDGNWLVSYAAIEGIDRVLKGMSRRTPFVSGMEHAAAELRNHYELYESEFTRFFSELISYSEAQTGTKIPMHAA